LHEYNQDKLHIISMSLFTTKKVLKDFSNNSSLTIFLTRY